MSESLRATPPEAPCDPWAASGADAQDYPPGLYVVATPLGNAADMSLRALAVLSRADAIAAEDTRTTAPLLARYGIRATLLAHHRHNEAAGTQALLERLARGERVALVSDAGTPGINDPGARVVRAALAAGHRCLPVPGPSALAALLSVSGLEGPVHFEGFLPAREGERRRRLGELLGGAFVFFEVPHRLAQTARDLADLAGDHRRVVIGRELTKRFEQVTALSLEQLAGHLDAHPPRGEYVIAVDAPESLAATTLDADQRRWFEALAPELPPARLAALAARITGLPRETLYELACSMVPRGR